ncbi:hypothetical protein Daus18300_009377 [Diaporthe australafricana]|uniref:RRM domain-containing protein n=1 Tax=Diaporthe australafricana TaxID=127596 RepID=A0ABR3WED2_9PEZI
MNIYAYQHEDKTWGWVVMLSQPCIPFLLTEPKYSSVSRFTRHSQLGWIGLCENQPYIQMPKSMHPPLENPLCEYFGYASGCSPYRLYAPPSEDQASSSKSATANPSSLDNDPPLIIDPCCANPPKPGAPVNGKCKHNGVYREIPGDSRYTDRHNTTIFVGGLSARMTGDHLAYWFKGFGELYHVRKKSNRGRRGTNGFVHGETCGYVQFADRKVAEMAMAQMQGYPVWGHRLRLSWGSPKIYLDMKYWRVYEQAAWQAFRIPGPHQHNAHPDYWP